jgi:hypothetical protein
LHDLFLSGHYSGALQMLAIAIISQARMELPIFNDNLKSSAAWTTQLARAQENWKTARADDEQLPARLRQMQVEQLLPRAGQTTDKARLRDAANLISDWAAETEAKLNVERLLTLHRVLLGSEPTTDVLRKTEPLPLNPAHDPTPAVLLPRMLDHAFDWFATQSFAELHPVEQATVVYLRLLDLHPFPTATEPTALLAASFYTERAGLPPLIIFTDDVTQARYDQALNAAFRMLTQPLVELFAEMLLRAMQQAQDVQQ